MHREKDQSAGNATSELILAVRSGDSQAFDRLCELYAPLIGSLVSSADEQYRRYGSEAEDLGQEASLALYRAAMSYRLDQSDVTFGLYAKICIRNRLISAGRRLIRYYNARTATAKSAARPVREAGSSGSVGSHAVLTPDLSAFSEYERKIYALYSRGYSYARIAKEVGRSDKSVDNAICRIRRKLRQQMNQS